MVIHCHPCHSLILVYFELSSVCSLQMSNFAFKKTLQAIGNMKNGWTIADWSSLVFVKHQPWSGVQSVVSSSTLTPPCVLDLNEGPWGLRLVESMRLWGKRGRGLSVDSSKWIWNKEKLGNMRTYPIFLEVRNWYFLLCFFFLQPVTIANCDKVFGQTFRRPSGKSGKTMVKQAKRGSGKKSGGKNSESLKNGAKAGGRWTNKGKVWLKQENVNQLIVWEDLQSLLDAVSGVQRRFSTQDYSNQVAPLSQALWFVTS